MRLLGCNGGIGGTGRLTTCYLLGESVLVDAGTGLGSLSLDEMLRIDHVVLTHAHFDHIACLPLLLDAVAGQRDTPVRVWALPEVIEILGAHIFNDAIWPDFRTIPTADAPFLSFHALPESVTLAGLRISPLPASHGIPACGLRIEHEGVAVAFSGDTADCPAFWQALAGDAELRAVVVECSYPSSMTAMADLSMHMDSSRLAPRLAALPPGVAAVVIHRKPGLEDQIAEELTSALSGRDLRLPVPGTAYRFG